MMSSTPPIARRLAVAAATCLCCLSLAVGCDEPRDTGKSTAKKGKEPIKTREVLGKRTQDIRDASVETKKAGAEIKQPKIIAKDPITLQGNAYVSIIGQTSILNIKHAIDLYQAEHGEYPKTYQEFMDNIIKANNIALPTLPFYQEYGYDAPNHKLVILEYPERKEQFQDQQDKMLGRK